MFGRIEPDETSTHDESEGRDKGIQSKQGQRGRNGDNTESIPSSRVQKYLNGHQAMKRASAITGSANGSGVSREESYIDTSIIL